MYAQNEQVHIGAWPSFSLYDPFAHALGFEVNTAVGTAAVRGTDWFIEASPGAAQVGVLEGSVSLTSAATRRTETIPARWGARLEAGRDPVPARVWSPAEFQAVIKEVESYNPRPSIFYHELAKGAEPARLTREAKAALERLERRGESR